MRRGVAVLVAAAVLGSLAAGFLGGNGPEGLNARGVDPDATGMRLWEAWAKGYVTIKQVVPPGETQPIGFQVSNSANVSVVIDEYPMLLSPNPVAGPFGAPETTQDGALDHAAIPAGSTYVYWYANVVLDGTRPGQPIWFCTEEYEYVHEDIVVNLAGEILPFDYETAFTNPYFTDYGPQPPREYGHNSQEDIWVGLKENATVVVGKTPLVRSITNQAGQSLLMRLSATNISPRDDDDTIPGSPDANGAVVVDTIPANWGYGGFSLSPNSDTANADGTHTLKWIVNLPAANVTGRDKQDPTPYHNVQITYNLVTPNGLSGGRMYLPRAQVDTDGDGDLDAHSAEPLLEITQVNRPPTVTLAAASAFEGAEMTFTATASDPDGDPLTYSFDFDNDGVFDVVNSSSNVAKHTWWDDHVGQARVRVSDGKATAEATTSVLVTNKIPALTLTVAISADEGQAVTLSYHIDDPGSDDEYATVDWADGSSDSRTYLLGPFPDPPESNDQPDPRSISDSISHVYGDDALLGGTLTVQDDDGGSFATGFTVTINNLAPSITMVLVNSGDEGAPVPFTATASDPGSDDLEFFWSWDDGLSESRRYFNDGTGPDPYPSTGGTFPFTATDSGAHVWGDNAVYTVALTVTDDDGGSATVTQTVQIANVAPTVSLSLDAAVYLEDDPTSASADFTDAGSDDVILSWSWAYGPTATHTFFNDGAGPDPPKSPWGMYPFSGSDAMAHTYGDDGTFLLSVQACDDDGGCSVAAVDVVMLNVAPAVSLRTIPTGPEGIAALLFQADAMDPGSDDLTFSWWGQCSGWTAPTVYLNDPTVGPDPDPSPDVNPRDVTDSQSVVCGDNGLFAWNLEVQDDDGGVTTLTGVFTVDNVPPSLAVAPPQQVAVDEANAVTLAATAADPGSDDLTFTWQWDYGPMETRTYFNDGVGPDPPQSPDGTFPFTASDSSTHTYGDDCLCRVGLTVQDDDGGVITYETTVQVLNVAPALDVQAYVVANVTLRVAGEKWHDVRLDFVLDGDVTATMRIVRYPGSPDRQSGTITGHIDLLHDFKIVVYYTPDDDPINGQRNGDNPAWVILTLPSGRVVRLFHNFNVQHPGTWVWTLDDFRPQILGERITFDLTGTDVGSDDLTFDLEYGDGALWSAIAYNDGVGPDPYPSPDVSPITAAASTMHAYTVAGSYVLLAKVTDDDGGSVWQAFLIAVG